MELSSSDKERIQHQYDALAKKTLVGEAKSHRRTLAKRAAREVTFSDLSESELAQLFTTDEYDEYYGAAEPPVRGGVSHLSGQTEPPKNYFPSERDLIP